MRLKMIPTAVRRERHTLSLLTAVVLAVLILLRTVSMALPGETVTVSIVGEDGDPILTDTLVLDDLSFDLAPYVEAESTDLSDEAPSALHAVIALLLNGGYDPTDPEVLLAFDSDYGIYLASILGTSEPVYWTFQIDGEDSMVGVFAHKLSDSETLTFVWTEYVPEPEPGTDAGFVHDPSGLPAQDIDVPAALDAVAASLEGTSGDWEMLGMIRYGAGDRVDVDAWMETAYTRLTDPAQSTTDLQRLIIIWTALGLDARDVSLDGEKTDLLSRMPPAPEMDIYTKIFALAALDSAGYPDPDDAETSRVAIVQALLDDRLDDGGWSWSDTESNSDTDTTAMAITALAPYMSTPQVETAVEEALLLLSSRQAEDGTMGSSNATAMTLLALSALGIDGQEDPLFTKADGDLLSGLFRYRSEEGLFGFLDTESDPYATEQAFRALVCWQKMIQTGTPQSATVFAASPAALTAGEALPYESVQPETEEVPSLYLWGGGILVIAAIALILWKVFRSRAKESDV